MADGSDRRIGGRGALLTRNGRASDGRWRNLHLEGADVGSVSPTALAIEGQSCDKAGATLVGVKVEKFLPLSIAGLPGSNAMVSVGPPLS